MISQGEGDGESGAASGTEKRAPEERRSETQLGRSSVTTLCVEDEVVEAARREGKRATAHADEGAQLATSSNSPCHDSWAGGPISCVVVPTRIPVAVNAYYLFLYQLLIKKSFNIYTCKEKLNFSFICTIFILETILTFENLEPKLLVERTHT